MSRTGESAAEWLRPADEAILRCLDEGGVEYAAIVANRTGLHVPYVERRCSVLEERGLIEAVSGEVVYRVTEQGRRHA